MKTWRQILVELRGLHDTRLSMAHASIYHGRYVDMCVELNTDLRKQTGRDYTSFSKEEIDSAVLEVGLQLEES